MSTTDAPRLLRLRLIASAGNSAASWQATEDVPLVLLVVEATEPEADASPSPARPGRFRILDAGLLE